MSFKMAVAATLVAVATAASLAPLPAIAAESKTIVLTPHGKQAAAFREGFRVYGWAKSAVNRASTNQRGTGNGAGISQTGAGNWGTIVQRGRNNSATLAQNGNNNAMAIFQVGRGQTYDGSQTGNGKTGIVIQVGR